MMNPQSRAEQLKALRQGRGRLDDNEEDDLLRQQREFQACKQKNAAAKVRRSTNSNNRDRDTDSNNNKQSRAISKFKQQQQRQQQQSFQASSASIVSNGIIEHDVDNSSIQNPINTNGNGAAANDATAMPRSTR